MAMKFSLIVCTYMRAKPLYNLLQSVQTQTLFPDQILIIDGSRNAETKIMIGENPFRNLEYYQVSETNRGLTKQRNYGIDKVAADSEIVCFLDDDTVLKPDYFQNIIQSFKNNQDAIGVGGVAINESSWNINERGIRTSAQYYTLDGYYIKESSRNYLRNLLGLGSDKLPNVMPSFSHGRTCQYPLNGQDYKVDLLVGMSMAFKKLLFDSIRFSTYFEGYGLYEDADFSIRALAFGQNYMATSVHLEHFHDKSGRPNQYQYGKMVVRNGWYVWRLKHPDPDFKSKLKWHGITLLLTLIRFANIFTTSQRKASFTESTGRILGWFSLFLNKPCVER